MEVRILGAHNSESATTKLVSLLFDDILAVDAGSLTSSLPLAQQEKIEFILLTHGHYDHIRDVPAIAFNNFYRTINIYAAKITLDILSAHFINGIIYPKFTEMPSPESPALKLHTLEPYETESIGKYKVLPVPVNHTDPTVGYQISSDDGKAIFYSGDTGPGLTSCWEHISPQLILMDVTLSNKFEDTAVKSGHLCSALLAEELISFRRSKGYLPQVILIHLSPQLEIEIRHEAAQLAKELGANISLAYEGMKIEL